tara:strand:- start:46 stop:963 length:918 start_codon:yes stop_codon:yes gene_type:complete
VESNNKLTVLDLFSGIGGFSLGLESTGHFKTIAFCEKDKFCQKVLQKNFPNITIEGEIRDVKGEKYKADVVCGGFPCQPFSVAGKRKGTDDDRYLWDETIRVVRECKPKWFIGENVEGIINIQEGMVLRQVQTDLEKEGFEVQCLIIPASGIGAWHQRKRVWIIGCNVSNTDSGMRRRGRAIGESGTNEVWRFHIEKEKQSEQNFRSKTIGCNVVSGEKQNVSDSKCFRTQVQIKRKDSSIKMSRGTSQKTWWQTQSQLCGVPNGVSYKLDKDRANRIKALGNSIVPQIIRELGLAIIYAERETS